MIVVDGNHNSNRPRFMFDSVSIFLQACLQIPPEWQLRIHPSMNVTAPPWRYPGKQNQRNASPPSNLARQERFTVTSPTIKDNVEEEEEQLGDGGIDVAEEAAAAIAAGLDFGDDNNADINAASIDVNKIPDTLGMTNERQKEIQGSLFRMLGHENDNNNNNSNQAPARGSPKVGENHDGAALNGGGASGSNAPSREEDL